MLVDEVEFFRYLVEILDYCHLMTEQIVQTDSAIQATEEQNRHAKKIALVVEQQLTQQQRSGSFLRSCPLSIFHQGIFLFR